jgi:tetraacyldisaccharide 4'-kinase
MRPPAFWLVREGRDAAPVLRLLLSPLAALYAAATARRLRTGTPVRVPVPVVCVGNLTLGGTGKSPLARLVRARLTALTGLPAAVVSRGHGGQLEGPVRVDPGLHTSRDVGDEPLMLARDGPVFIGRDRAAAARLAVQAGMGALVLDDGHQNPALHKDLSLVVVDGETGFGNGWVVPSGPLREPVEAGLARADAVILMGGTPDNHQDIGFPGFTGPILRAGLQAARQRFGGPVAAFCGIGRPEKFDATLHKLGAEIATFLPFPDHHPYTEQDIQRIRKAARQFGASRIVTTEKDFVRLPPEFAREVMAVPVEAVVPAADALDRLLEGAIHACARRTGAPHPAHPEAKL